MHVVYVISHVQKSMVFEWTAKALRKKYTLTFILLNPSTSPLEEFLRKENIDVKTIHYSGKKDFITAFLRLYFYFLFKRPAVAHMHLLDAQLLGLMATWLAGIKKRIYTRHNSSFHHEYFRSGIKYDRLSNWFATHIISISQATDYTLKQLENVKPEKIRHIPHGFDFIDLLKSDGNGKNQVLKNWNIQEGSPKIGVIARHIEWKGIQYAVSAFKDFIKEYPNACLILANAHGPYHQTILKALEPVPKKNYVIIPFEKDVASLYRLFDMFVHVPVNSHCEAFGQTYIEALAFKIPSIFTLSGIAAEFIVNNEHALVVDFMDSDSIVKALKLLWRDPALRRHLGNSGNASVILNYHLMNMVNSLNNLYNE